MQREEGENKQPTARAVPNSRPSVSPVPPPPPGYLGNGERCQGLVSLLGTDGYVLQRWGAEGSGLRRKGGLIKGVDLLKGAGAGAGAESEPLLTEWGTLEASSVCWNGLGLPLPSEVAEACRPRARGWIVPGLVCRGETHDWWQRPAKTIGKGGSTSSRERGNSGLTNLLSV